jgi:hypothetical protein
MKFTLLQWGEVYSPEPHAKQSFLLGGSQLPYIGVLNEQKLRATGLVYEVELIA